MVTEMKPEMNERQPPWIRRTVSIPRETDAALVALAAAESRSVSYLVTQAVRLLLVTKGAAH